MLDYKSFSEQLNGLWDSVLLQYGIDVGDFKNLNTKNTACPLCGGTDRAHWREQNGRIALYCRHCTDGSMKSAEDVIMEATGIGYNELVIELSKFVNHVPMETIYKAKVKAQAKPTRNMPVDHKQDHVLAEKFMQSCEWCHSMNLLARNAPNPQKLPSKNDVDYWTIHNDKGVIVNLAKMVNDLPVFIAKGQSYGCLYTIQGGKRTIIVVDPIDGILCWYKTKATIYVAFTFENLRYTLRNRNDIAPIACLRDESQLNELQDDYDVRLVTGDGYGKFEIIKAKEKSC